jgi:hypothetical protein
MIPLRPLLPRPPWDIPDDEPTEDEDWAHEETECEYKWERMMEGEWVWQTK